MIKLSDVYGTSRSFPRTYVTRTSVDNRFVNDITRDKHLVIYGGSKQGKTCLRKYHLREEEYIVVQCTRETTKASLYEILLKHSGINCSISQSTTVKGNTKLSVTVSGEVKLPFVAKGSSGGSGELGQETERTVEQNSFEIDPEDPNDVARVLQAAKFKKYVVIEDFHYLDEDVQRALSVDLKVFHEVSSLVFIIVGVWLESSRLTMYNGDLSGRLATINADEWLSDELESVISSGENILNITLPKEVKAAIVDGCQGNVGLLQEVCYRICEKYSVWNKQNSRKCIGQLSDVQEMLKSVSNEQSSRYRNFLGKFSEGLGETQLKMYQWIALIVIQSSSEELRRGLRHNIIFQRIRTTHPSRESLQQNNVTQALERVAKVQYKHGLQPFVFDYSNDELVVVDVNFIIYLQNQPQDDLVRMIGL